MGNNQLGKDAAILSFSKVMIMIISLLANMLLSRFRTVEEYGTYSQLMILITLGISFFTLGFPSSPNYFLPLCKSKNERNNFLSIYYTVNTIICIIIGIVLSISITGIEKYFNNHSLHKYIFFLALYPWAYVTISGISNILVVYRKAIVLAYINIAVAIVTLCSVIIVEFFNFSFKDFLVLFLSGNIIVTIFIHVYVNKLEYKLKFKINVNTIKNIAKYSIPLGLASLVGTINIEMDKLMIGKMMDTESLAYYANAGRELPLTFISVSLTAVLMPQIVKLLNHKDYRGAIHIWGDTIVISYIILSFAVTMCIVFAPQIITILYSNKYLPGVNVFRIYSLILLLRFTYWGIVLNALGKTKFIFISSIISLLLNIGLNYIFYLLFSFNGPALASFISILLVNILQLYFTSFHIQISIKQIFPWRSIGYITFLNILIGSVCFLFTSSYGTEVIDIIKSICIGIFIGIIYILLMYKKIKKHWINLNTIPNENMSFNESTPCI